MEKEMYEFTRNSNCSALGEERRASSEAYSTALKENLNNYILIWERLTASSPQNNEGNSVYAWSPSYSRASNAEDFGNSPQMQDPGDGDNAEEECATSSSNSCIISSTQGF